MLGVTIRNVVMDSSCSVVSSCNGSDSVCVGTFAGYCYDLTIENTVNMAGVSFTGNTSDFLYIGGITGYLDASSNDVTVRNCANCGSVTYSGTGSSVYIGGIVGYYSGSSSDKFYIKNCLNYGTVNHSGTTTTNWMYIGGILGQASGTSSLRTVCVVEKSLQTKQVVALEVL